MARCKRLRNTITTAAEPQVATVATVSANATLSRSMETLCSDAIERIARMIAVPVDLDDSKPALVAAVERKIATFVDRLPQSAPADGVA